MAYKCGAIQNSSSMSHSFPEICKPSYVQPNPVLMCVFCFTANHASHECERFQSPKKFWEILLLERRCQNCLRFYHKSHKCFDQTFCNLKGCRRFDKHSPVLCHARYVRNLHQFNGYKHFYKSKMRVNVAEYYHPQPFNSKKSSHHLHPNIHNSEPLPLYNHRRRCKKLAGRSKHRCNFKSSSDNVYVPETQVHAKNTVNVSTQTLDLKRDVAMESKMSQCSAKEKILVSVSVQTEVNIPPFVDVNRDSPDDFVELVDESGSRSIIKKDDYEKRNNYEYMDVPSATCTKNLYPDVKKPAAAENLSYPEVKQPTADPFDSISEVVAKAREQAIKGFRNFPHWK